MSELVGHKPAVASAMTKLQNDHLLLAKARCWRPARPTASVLTVEGPKTAARPSKPGVGDLVAKLAHAVGCVEQPGCGCEAMRQQMNRWGWTGCVRHWSDIQAHFIKHGGEACAGTWDRVTQNFWAVWKGQNDDDGKTDVPGDVRPAEQSDVGSDSARVR